MLSCNREAGASSVLHTTKNLKNAALQQGHHYSEREAREIKAPITCIPRMYIASQLASIGLNGVCMSAYGGVDKGSAPTGTTAGGGRL